MALKEVRDMFVQATNRYDLISSDGLDAGANQWINAGQRLLDRMQKNPGGNQRFQIDLEAGQYSVMTPPTDVYENLFDSGLGANVINESSITLQKNLELSNVPAFTLAGDNWTNSVMAVDPSMTQIVAGGSGSDGIYDSATLGVFVVLNDIIYAHMTPSGIWIIYQELVLDHQWIPAGIMTESLVEGWQYITLGTASGFVYGGHPPGDPITVIPRFGFYIGVDGFEFVTFWEPITAEVGVTVAGSGIEKFNNSISITYSPPSVTGVVWNSVWRIDNHNDYWSSLEEYQQLLNFFYQDLDPVVASYLGTAIEEPTLELVGQYPHDLEVGETYKITVTVNPRRYTPWTGASKLKFRFEFSATNYSEWYTPDFDTLEGPLDYSFYIVYESGDNPLIRVAQVDSLSLGQLDFYPIQIEKVVDFVDVPTTLVSGAVLRENFYYQLAYFATNPSGEIVPVQFGNTDGIEIAPSGAYTEILQFKVSTTRPNVLVFKAPVSAQDEVEITLTGLTLRPYISGSWQYPQRIVSNVAKEAWSYNYPLQAVQYDTDGSGFTINFKKTLFQVTVGSVYILTYTVRSITEGLLIRPKFGNLYGATRGIAGTYIESFVATNPLIEIQFLADKSIAGTAGTIVIDDISVQLSYTKAAALDYILAVNEVYWIANDGSRHKLERKSVKEISEMFPEDISSMSTGTPRYYTLQRTQLGGSQAGLNTNSPFFTRDLTGLVYRTPTVRDILITPPPNETSTLRIDGRFYSLTLVDDTDMSFWTEMVPHILVLAAAYVMESVLYRNSEGSKDWLSNLQFELRNIDINEALEEWAETNQMEG